MASSGLPQRTFAPDQFIASYALELAFNKTTMLIFRAPVRAVDLGSRDILADKVPGVENVLRLKANRIGFNETNLSVMTVDGRFYSFVATYNEQPRALAVRVTPAADRFEPDRSAAPSGEPSGLRFPGRQTDEATLRTSLDHLLRRPGRTIRRVQGQRLRGAVTGLFTEGNLLLVRFRLQNRSDVPLVLEPPRFRLVDAGRVRESARQELDQVPVLAYPAPATQLTSRTRGEWVYALPRVTPARRQRLVLQLVEATGGRSLSFSLTGRQLLRARHLPLESSDAGARSR